MSRYLAINPRDFGGLYGQGESIEQAEASLESVGGDVSNVIVARLPEGAENAYFDTFFGTVSWTWAPGADREGTLEEVARSGISTADLPVLTGAPA